NGAHTSMDQIPRKPVPYRIDTVPPLPQLPVDQELIGERRSNEQSQTPARPFVDQSYACRGGKCPVRYQSTSNQGGACDCQCPCHANENDRDLNLAPTTPHDTIGRGDQSNFTTPAKLFDDWPLPTPINYHASTTSIPYIGRSSALNLPDESLPI